MPGPALPVSNSMSPELIVPEFAEPAHPRDFVRRQRRKGLLVAGKRKG